jgi:hypothetical protein
MSYELLQTDELQRLDTMVVKYEIQVNVTEPASTDNLVFSGDEFNIRTDFPREAK